MCLKLIFVISPNHIAYGPDIKRYANPIQGLSKISMFKRYIYNRTIIIDTIINTIPIIPYLCKNILIIFTNNKDIITYILLFRLL